MLIDYLLRVHKEKLREILISNETTKHHSINIPFVQLFEEDYSLASSLLNTPDDALKIIKQQLDLTQDKIHAELITLESNQETVQTFKENFAQFKDLIHLRVYDLHFCTEVNLFQFPKTEESSYLQISGTVTRISAVKLLKFKRDFLCSKCKEIITVIAAYERKYLIFPPKRCCNEHCNSTQLIEVEDMQPAYCKDYQEIKIQEDLTLLGSGVMPNSMWVTLEDDLADLCKPGDSVTICGLVKRRTGPLVVGKRIDVSLALQAHHVSINNISDAGVQDSLKVPTNFETFWRKHRSVDELYARDMILRSLSPEIHGMYLVKLAVAVVLAGGGGGSDATQTRTQPHLLLVGDPGTGKSQILRHAAKVIPRSVCTTGIGSTSAGLTVATIMEDGEWQLEAGALVLSDGGICCIDEFHTMREHDRTSIHEAMEQQSISVAKASIVCKLNTRCSILAAANPQGPFDACKPLSCNIGLASPLLSRFDLILALKDKVDETRDMQLADFILRRYRPKATQLNSESTNNEVEIWCLDMLKDYYREIRKRKPNLTSKVTPILNAYYQYRRKRKFRNEARTTVRLLDSLVRLSKAHAKLMYHDDVTVVDAVMAIALLEASIEVEAPDVGAMFDPQSEFPEDSAEWYKKVEEIIFDKLQLQPREFVSFNINECSTMAESTSTGLVDCNFQVRDNKKQADDQMFQDQVNRSVNKEYSEIQYTIPVSLLQSLPELSELEAHDVSYSEKLCLNLDIPYFSLGVADATFEYDTPACPATTVAVAFDTTPATPTTDSVAVTVPVGILRRNEKSERKLSLKKEFGFVRRVRNANPADVNEVIRLDSNESKILRTVNAETLSLCSMDISTPECDVNKTKNFFIDEDLDDVDLEYTV